MPKKPTESQTLEDSAAPKKKPRTAKRKTVSRSQRSPAPAGATEQRTQNASRQDIAWAAVGLVFFCGVGIFTLLVFFLVRACGLALQAWGRDDFLSLQTASLTLAQYLREIIDYFINPMGDLPFPFRPLPNLSDHPR